MVEHIRIAVVIPAYNRARFIADALDSVAAQSRWPDEVIVVDDGSTDGTPDVVRAWRASHSLPLTLVCQPNGGASSARNRAIRQSSADLIAPLDSDDVWLPQHLEVLESAFARHADLAVAAGNTERLDDLPQFKRAAYDESLCSRFKYDTDECGLRLIEGCAYTSLLHGAYIHTSSCMFRKPDAERVGLFEESLRSYEDQQFFMRLSKQGRFGVYMEPITLVRKHDQNLTHRRYIASHIVCGITVLERAIQDAEAMCLTEDELRATCGELERRLAGAVNRASRYGWRPYWVVCKELVRRGHLSAILRPKPLVRAVVRPRGDKTKLQAAVAAS